jgi:hypothetical protein
MQVNSAQDYTTALKRRIVAATYISNPPPIKRRNNTVYTSVLATRNSVILVFALPLYPYAKVTTGTCCLATSAPSNLPGSLV